MDTHISLLFQSTWFHVVPGPPAVSGEPVLQFQDRDDAQRFLRPLLHDSTAMVGIRRAVTELQDAPSQHPRDDHEMLVNFCALLATERLHLRRQADTGESVPRPGVPDWTRTHHRLMAKLSAGEDAEPMPTGADDRLRTDRRLMAEASRLTFNPRRDHTVLWSGRRNKDLATRFCEAHRGAGYETLESILARYYSTFYRELCELSWSESAEIWYYLSIRLAESASGQVRVFAAGIVNPEDDPSGAVDVGKYKSVHKSHRGRSAYANSVFEKCEGPALDHNRRVEKVLLMGTDINSKPHEW